MKIIRGYLDFAYSCANVFLSLSLSFPFSLSLSLSVFRFMNVATTSGRTLCSHCSARDMSKFPYATRGYPIKSDGDIPADFARLTHPEVSTSLCSTLCRCTSCCLLYTLLVDCIVFRINYYANSLQGNFGDWWLNCTVHDMDFKL